MYSALFNNFILNLVLLLFVGQIYAQKAPETFNPPEFPLRISAHKIYSPILLDGKLLETEWDSAKVIKDFVQQNPLQGAPATFDTEVRILYDEKYLYIGAICHDDFSISGNLRVQNLRRDYIWDLNDGFGIAIDGFMDKRFAVSFQTTPLGNIRDLQAIDAEYYNRDWDALWSAKTSVEKDKWTVEMAIPWKSLRYPEGAEALGIILFRNIRRFNEYTVKPSVPRVFDPYRMAYEAVLTDINPPKPSANIQVNPYLLAEAANNVENETKFQTVTPKAGGEIKWAINPNTVLDLTVNTDFAQADVDRQVINLERFSVLFPERRQFFLENAEIFRASLNSFIQPFFSRKIGLDDFGNPIPLHGGMRFTNQNSKQAIGVLAMSQNASATTGESRFGVARYVRYMGSQSKLGGMVTYRNDLDNENFTGNSNYTYTIDGVYRPNQKFNVQGMVSASLDGEKGEGIASQVWTSYRNNSLYVGWLGYYVYDYNPGMGLERFGRNYFYNSPAIDFDLRPTWLPQQIRRLKPTAYAGIFHKHDLSGIISADISVLPVVIEWQNGSEIKYQLSSLRQNLDFEERFVGIAVKEGTYAYWRQQLTYNTDLSNKISGSAAIATGGYFDGSLHSVTTSLRWAPIPYIELAADYIFNAITALGSEKQDLNTHLFGINSRLAINPRLQFNGFYQWNSSINRSIWNMRASWEYKPLSFLYLVFNSNTSWLIDPQDRITNLQGIAKLTYIRQF
jgi:hypothetical protein